MRYGAVGRIRKMGFISGVSKTVIQQYSVFKAVSTMQESILPGNTFTNSCYVEF